MRFQPALPPRGNYLRDTQQIRHRCATAHPKRSCDGGFTTGLTCSCKWFVQGFSNCNVFDVDEGVNVSERHSARGRHRRHTRSASQPVFAVGAVAAAALFPQMTSAAPNSDSAAAHSSVADIHEVTPEMLAAAQTLWDSQNKSALVTDGQKDSTERQADASRASRNNARAPMKTGAAAPTVTVPKTVLPVQIADRPITSGFGMRMHPKLHTMRMHDGIDFGVPEGTKVHAVRPGTVTYASEMRGYGYRVVIKHAGGFYTTYNHLSKFEVKVGETVAIDDVIARSGSTGLGTGAHLHFEVNTGSRADGNDKSEYTNPLTWLRKQDLKV